MVATRLTGRLGIRHPIIQAPMASAAGRKLAAAVSRAGGLGLIGGGYGDEQWLMEQFEAAGNQPVGCGLITWSLQGQPDLLNAVLARAPKALFLSFGDPAPFAVKIKAAKVSLICQIQTLRDAKHAIDIGARHCRCPRSRGRWPWRETRDIYARSGGGRLQRLT